MEDKKIKNQKEFNDILDYAMRNIGHVTAYYYSAKIQFEGHEKWRISLASNIEDYIREALQCFGRISNSLSVAYNIDHYNTGTIKLNKAIEKYNALVKELGKPIEINCGSAPSLDSPIQYGETSNTEKREILF